MLVISYYPRLDFTLPELPKLYNLVIQDSLIVSNRDVELLIIKHKSVKFSINNIYLRIQFNFKSRQPSFQLLCLFDKLIESVITLIYRRLVTLFLRCKKDCFRYKSDIICQFRLTNILFLHCLLLFECALHKLSLLFGYNLAHSIIDFVPVQLVNLLPGVWIRRSFVFGCQVRFEGLIVRLTGVVFLHYFSI